MHKKKILVIDDETDFLRLLEMRLEANGYEVITASDGKEGLDKLRSAKPDAVILDIMMPKMDGLNVLKAVRKHDKNLPVFIVTAYNDPDKIAASQDLDASGFIVKTADLGEEIRRITSALNIADRYRSL